VSFGIFFFWRGRRLSSACGLYIPESPFQKNRPMRQRPSSSGSAKKAGLPPGSLIYVGDQPAAVDRLSLFAYNEQDFIERTFTEVEDCIANLATALNKVTWINVDGVNRPGLLEAFGKALDLHPLTLEDVLNTEQRPKVEDYCNYLYIVIIMLELDPDSDALGIEQLVSY
jgi:magnesium transporter